MLNSFKSLIQRVVNKVLRRSTVTETLKQEVAISDEMINAITLWADMYDGNIGGNIKRMGLATSIASELARLVTLEFESEITGNDYLNSQYQQALKQLRNYTEFACAKGGIVFKPYVVGDAIEVDYVQAERFYPLAYNSRGEVTSAAFVEYKQKGDDLYTRIEAHEWTLNEYRITNKAYHKKKYNNYGGVDDFGTPTMLNTVEEWANLENEISIRNIDRPLFAYFKMPLANHIDNDSPLGVSVFSRAIRDIQEADEQYDRILWEYKGSELAVFADVELFRSKETGEYIIPHGAERLYKRLDFDEDKEKFRIFNPDIRDESLFNGLNQLLRKIEFKCGLAYGTLSDVQDVDKTAEEIRSSKQRSYSTVKDIQNNLEVALTELIEAMHALCHLYGLDTTDYDVTFNWDDSLILNKNDELASMQSDVVAGLLRPELYLAKKYGCSVEEALKMMPNTEESIKSPFFGLEE